MSLFARSDLMSVTIPAMSGGCGKTHSRPVTHGKPRTVWELACPACEAYLKGDNKPRVIKVSGGDKNRGIAPKMNHVADSDPHWSSTPETVPPTPDEEQVHAVRAEIGKEQLEMINALAAAKQAGIDIPKEALWLLERNLDPKVLQGQVECMNGHPNYAGAKFCAECAVDMKARASIEDGKQDLSRLSVKALKELCREEALPVHGTKAQLIERLS